MGCVVNFWIGIFFSVTCHRLFFMMAPTTQHRLALAFLSFALVILPLVIIPETADPVVPIQMLLLSGIVLALLSLLVVAAVQVGWGKWSMRFWWAFMGWGVVASCFGMVPLEGFLETARLLVLTGFGLLCCWAMRVIAEPSKWLGLLCAMALIVIGGIGVGQHFGIGTGIPGFNGLPSGTLGNANFFGAALQLLLPGAVLGLRSRGMGKLLAILGLVVGGCGLYWSGSEAAWLGLGMSALVSVAYLLPAFVGKSSNWKLGLRSLVLVGIFVVGLLGLVVVSRSLMQEIGEQDIAITQNSGRERLLLWEGSIAIVNAHPLLGCGPENWNYAILEQGVVGAAQGFGTRYYMQAHSDFVQNTAEYGVLGGILFLLFLGQAWGAGWRRQRLGASGETQWLSGLALGGLSGWIVNAGLSFPFHRPYLVLLLFVWLSVLGRDEPVLPLQPRWFRRGTWAFIGAAALSWLVWSGLKIKGNSANFKVMEAKESLNFSEVARLAHDAAAWYNWEDGITKTPLAWYEGNALLNMGQQDAAFVPLESAWRQNPWHPMVANNYAIALAMKGRIQEAIPLMEQLLKTFPAFDDTRVNLTRLYIATRRFEQAEALVRYWDGQLTNSLVNQVRGELEAARLGSR
jgi:O-antigen ligase